MLFDTPVVEVRYASPDGPWFAYVSDHSGRPELYLRALGGSDVQLQIFVDGGTEPVWSRNGREIFYRSGSRLKAARLVLRAEPSVVSRPDLFDLSAYDGEAPESGWVELRFFRSAGCATVTWELIRLPGGRAQHASSWTCARRPI